MLIHRKVLLFLLALVPLAACQTGSGQPSDDGVSRPNATAGLTAPATVTQPPYYRFWRGKRRPDLTADQFVAKLTGTFIPATPKTMAPYGLLAYLPALAPATHASVIPDEVALVVYRSSADYQAAAAAPDGKAYQQLHWQLFDKATSHSLVPSPTGSVNGLQAEHAYDLIHRPVDWQSQSVTLFIGQRKDEIAQPSFLQRLTRQLGQAAELYRRTGASAFVVLVASDYEIAYLAYPTTAATRKVLDSAEGKAVAAEGQGFMNTVLYAPALPFNGAAKPGDAFNVQFGLQPNAARGP